MIYYYFGDKEGLYLSALENAYRPVREGEAKLDIEDLPPLEALKRLVEFTFDHHHQHEDFIRMVMIENIHHGEYLERSKAIRELNVTAIDHIKTIYARGVKEGLFRAGLDPIELHWQISALCFFNVSNRATFSKIFGRDFGAADAQTSLRKNVVDMVLRYVMRADKLPKDSNWCCRCTACSGTDRNGDPLGDHAPASAKTPNVMPNLEMDGFDQGFRAGADMAVGLGQRLHHRVISTFGAAFMTAVDREGDRLNGAAFVRISPDAAIDAGRAFRVDIFRSVSCSV